MSNDTDDPTIPANVAEWSRFGRDLHRGDVLIHVNDESTDPPTWRPVTCGEVCDVIEARARIDAEFRRLVDSMMKESDEIEQALGQALGYPWFKDDRKNFPGATEAHGVCVGDHVPATLAREAATRIRGLEAQVAELRSRAEISA